MQDKSYSSRFKEISFDEINSLTKTSKMAYLYCLYTCNELIAVDIKGEPLINEISRKNHFNYKSTFFKIFCLHQDSLNTPYLNARKSLYKTMMILKNEKEQKLRKFYEKYNQTNIINQKELEFAFRNLNHEKNFYNKPTNTIFLSSQNTNHKIIFLDKINLKNLQSNTSNTSFISMSNLIHIYDNHCDIFTKDKTCIDIKDLEEEYGINLKELDTRIFFYSTLLTGSQELPNHPFFFGELDKEGNIKQEQPSYYFAPKDETLDKGKLTIYLHNLTLTLLNYSLSNESLKIKLKLTHKENIKTLEQTRLTLNQNKALEIKAKQSKASLYAVLEDDVIRCPHGGKVILKSNKGKSFKSNGVPLILESDYLNSKIQGCSHTIAGVSVPCTRVVNVKGSLSQKKVNDEFVILQELVSNSITNQGFALKCVPKLNQFIFDHSFNPLEGLEQQSKSLTKLQEPMIRLHYKSDRFQKDNLPIYRFSLNDNPRQENEPLTQLNLEKEILEIKDKEQENSQNTLTLLESLKNEFKKEMLFKQIKLKIDTNLIYIYFIIPQSIPKIYKEAYENYKDKDYGIGEFKQLHSYTNIKALKLSQEEVKDKMPNYTEYIFAFMTPYKAKKIKFEFALGIDECIRKEDEKEKKRVSEIVVVNGGFDVDW